MQSDHIHMQVCATDFFLLHCIYINGVRKMNTRCLFQMIWFGTSKKIQHAQHDISHKLPLLLCHVQFPAMLY